MPTAPIDTSLRRRLETRLDQLPVLPMALANLLSLDATDDEYFDDVLHILESEPNFGAKILIAANSAESSPKTPITTLGRAVARIGSRGAADLLLAMSVTRVFVPRDPWRKSLWRHGVEVAHAARGIAGHVEGIDPEEVYACALLHDIGRFVLFQEAPDQFRSVGEGDWETPQALVEQELSICGISHAELGAMACRKWRLPERIVRVVRRHHDLLPDHVTDEVDKVIAIVRLADFVMFPSVMPGGESLVQQLDDEALTKYFEGRVPSFLSLSGSQLRTIMVDAETHSEQVCQMLGVTP